ncbi:unnamed protein product [Ectocarpus sp. 13 AM-2016]
MKTHVGVGVGVAGLHHPSCQAPIGPETIKCTPSITLPSAEAINTHCFLSACSWSRLPPLSHQLQEYLTYTTHIYFKLRQKTKPTRSGGRIIEPKRTTHRMQLPPLQKSNFISQKGGGGGGRSTPPHVIQLTSSSETRMECRNFQGWCYILPVLPHYRKTKGTPSLGSFGYTGLTVCSPNQAWLFKPSQHSSQIHHTYLQDQSISGALTTTPSISTTFLYVQTETFSSG